MAANNRGNMRPANRSPPFLAIGLFVALVILGFNYWNLSVKNGEQFNEISVMERELKILSAKNTAIEKRAEAKDDKVNYLEEQLTKEKGTASEKAAALASAQNERESLIQGKAALQTEFDVVKEKVPLCEKEVESLKQALEAAKAELEQVKNAPAPQQTCGESECSQFVSGTRDKTLDNVLNVAGPDALIKLYRAGGDVGKFADQLKTLVESQAKQVKAAQPGNEGLPTNIGGQQGNPAGQPVLGTNNIEPQNPNPVQPGVEVKPDEQQPLQPSNEQLLVDQNAQGAVEQPEAGNQQAAQDPSGNVVQPQDGQFAGNDLQPQLPQGQVAAPIVGAATTLTGSHGDVNVTQSNFTTSIPTAETSTNVTQNAKPIFTTSNATVETRTNGSDPVNDDKGEVEQMPKPVGALDDNDGAVMKDDEDAAFNDDAADDDDDAAMDANAVIDDKGAVKDDNDDYDDPDDAGIRDDADDMKNVDEDELPKPDLLDGDVPKDDDDGDYEYDEDDDADNNNDDLDDDDDNYEYNEGDNNPAVDDLNKDENGIEEMRMKMDNAAA